MRISKLKIQHFRSIKDLDLELPNLCCIIGPNNAGKSNILQALKCVLANDWVTVNSFCLDDVHGKDDELDVLVEVTIDPPIKYRKIKGADPTDVPKLSYHYTRYVVGEFKGQRRLEQSCQKHDGESIVVQTSAFKKGSKPQFGPIVGIPQEVRDQVPVVYIGTNRSLKEHLPSARYSMLRQLLEDINRDFSKPENQVSVKSADGVTKTMARQDRFRELMDAALKLLHTNEFEKLESAIKKNALKQLGFDPDTDTDKLDFYFAPFDSIDFYKSLDLRVREGDFSISATELGDGVQNALVLSLLQAFEERRKKGAIFLIEEPEMFLHPQMQRSLYDTLRTISKNNQVIYTTHSPHFVSVPYFDEIAMTRKNEESTNVQKSNLPINASFREKLIKEMDPLRNELFFATRVVIVEGDTERLALPEYARRMERNLDRLGISIIEVGGKRNLKTFADIAISFGIPTVILYDTDSSDFSGKKDEETTFNQSLESMASDAKKVKVWKMDKDYEEVLRKTMGDAEYQALCQKYPNISKPIRARLIAADTSTKIPDFIQEVLKWLT